MLIRAFILMRKVREGSADPKSFAVEETMDFIKGFLILISAIALPIIAFLGVLGFSDWIINANGVARVFFWLFLVIWLFWFLVTRFIYRRIKRTVTHAANAIID